MEWLYVSLHFRHNEASLNHTESGYTTGPCNNASSRLVPANGTTSPTTPASAPNGSSAIQPTGENLSKNTNLLVNLPTKDDVGEKNNITGVNTTVMSNTSSSNMGTIGRNGTLCKKVYLWKRGLIFCFENLISFLKVRLILWFEEFIIPFMPLS